MFVNFEADFYEIWSKFNFANIAILPYLTFLRQFFFFRPVTENSLEKIVWVHDKYQQSKSYVKIKWQENTNFSCTTLNNKVDERAKS